MFIKKGAQRSPEVDPRHPKGDPMAAQGPPKAFGLLTQGEEGGKLPPSQRSLFFACFSSSLLSIYFPAFPSLCLPFSSCIFSAFLHFLSRHSLFIQNASAHSARPKNISTEGRRRFIVSSFVVSLLLLFRCLVVWSFVVLSFCCFVVRCDVVFLMDCTTGRRTIWENAPRMCPQSVKILPKVRKTFAVQKHRKHRVDWPSLALAVARLGRSNKPKGPRAQPHNMFFLKDIPNSMQKHKKKTKTQKWKVGKYVFLKCVTFFTKSGGLNGCMITAVLLKTIDKYVIKKAQRKTRKTRN